MQKRKTVLYIWKSHVLNPILLFIATEQCNKLENSIKTFKIIGIGDLQQIQKSSDFTLILKTGWNL